MTMSPSSWANDIFASLVAASILGATAWLYSHIRNVRLERLLKKSIQQNGIGWGFEEDTPTFTLQVHNYSTATVRIRSIHFRMDRFTIELEPHSEHGIRQIPLLNEIHQSKFKRQHLSRALERDGILDGVTMTLPPKTMGFWKVPTEEIGKYDWRVEKVYLTFEYPTVFGNGALVRMPIEGSGLASIKKVFNELSASVFEKRPMRSPDEIFGNRSQD